MTNDTTLAEVNYHEAQNGKMDIITNQQFYPILEDKANLLKSYQLMLGIFAQLDT